MSRSLSFSGHLAAAFLPAAALLALSTSPGQADDDSSAATRFDPVVVSATRLPTPASQLGSSVSVVTAEDIAAHQYRTLPEALRSVPGLEVLQTGGPGGTTSVYIRGAEARHTKVLVDGIEVSDPSAIDANFDLSQLSTADIARIEVLRGPQSGLYGSDAIGGVISITTRKGDGPAKVTGMVEGGSFGTFNQAAGASGSEGPLSYALTLSHNRATSVPVTPKGLVPAGVKRKDDLSDNKTVSTRLGYDLTDTVDVGLVARATRTELQTVAGPADGAHSNTANDEYFTRGMAHQILFDGRFDHEAGVAYTDFRRRYAGTDEVPYYYRGNRLKGDWRGNLTVAEGEVVTIGFEGQRDAINNDDTAGERHIDAHAFSSAGYAQLQSDWNKRVENALSVRYDDHSAFGGKTTFREAPALLIPETGTKLKASVGTGFRAPTLDQIYGNYDWGDYGYGGQHYHTYGNPDLRPERSIGFDAGFEQTLAGVRFGSTYFRNYIKDLIQYKAISSYDSTYVNISNGQTQGFENFIAYSPMSVLDLRADYTFTLAENADIHESLLRRPKHKASLTATWKASEKLSLSETAIFTGDWVDTDRINYSQRVKGSGYATINVAADYALTQNLGLFGRVTNLLDRKVENPVGFEQPGIGAFAGIKASF